MAGIKRWFDFSAKIHRQWVFQKVCTCRSNIAIKLLLRSIQVNKTAKDSSNLGILLGIPFCVVDYREFCRTQYENFRVTFDLSNSLTRNVYFLTIFSILEERRWRYSIGTITSICVRKIEQIAFVFSIWFQKLHYMKYNWFHFRKKFSIFLFQWNFSLWKTDIFLQKFQRVMIFFISASLHSNSRYLIVRYIRRKAKIMQKMPHNHPGSQNSPHITCFSYN